MNSYENTPVPAFEVDPELEYDKLISLIPKTSKSILYIGLMENNLSDKLIANYILSVINIDNDEAMGQLFLKLKAIATDSFDLIIIADVLPRLPDGAYKETKKEMLRISKQYIIATLPNEEILSSHTTQCPVCSHLYHVHNHLRSFSREKMINIFQERASLVKNTFDNVPYRFDDAHFHESEQALIKPHYYNDTAECSNCHNELKGKFTRDYKARVFDYLFEAYYYLCLLTKHIRHNAHSKFIGLYEIDSKTPSAFTECEKITFKRQEEYFPDSSLKRGNKNLFPSEIYMAESETDYFVLVIPQHIESMCIELNSECAKKHLRSVEVYDQLEKEYKPLAKSSETFYFNSMVLPSLKGYVFKINQAGCDVKRIKLKYVNDSYKFQYIYTYILPFLEKAKYYENINKFLIPLRKKVKLRHVLIISHMYPRPKHQTSGIFIKEQVEQLIKRGYKVTVISGEPYWINVRSPIRFLRGLRYYRRVISDRCFNDAILTYYAPYIVSKLIRPVFRYFLYYIGVKKVLAQHGNEFNDFTLIHAHTSFLDGYAARKLAKTFNVPYVITEHTGPFSALVSNWLMKRIVKENVAGASRIISVGKALKDDILDKLKIRNKQKISVIGNCVNINVFKKYSKKMPSDTICFIWVGHFVKGKGVDRLLKAFAKAVTQSGNVSLTLVGEGSEEKMLRSLAKKLGIYDQIIWHPLMNRQNLARLLGQNDCLIISSESETFGCVGIEAMACGLPVLSTKCGGPEDYITNEQVGLIVKNSIDGLMQGILKIAKNVDKFDSDYIRDFVVENYSGEVIAKKLSNVYDQFITSYKET